MDENSQKTHGVDCFCFLSCLTRLNEEIGLLVLFKSHRFRISYTAMCQKCEAMSRFDYSIWKQTMMHSI